VFYEGGKHLVFVDRQGACRSLSLSVLLEKLLKRKERVMVNNRFGFVLLFALLMGFCTSNVSADDVTLIKGWDAVNKKGAVIKTNPDGELYLYDTEPIKIIPFSDLHLDSMDSITAPVWSVLGNDTDNLAIASNHTEGTNSIEFDKIDGAANTAIAGIDATLAASWDATNVIVNNGTINVHIYVSSVADVAYAFVRLGTSDTAYTEWMLDDSAMSAGWNAMRVPASEVMATQGAGWDTNAIVYASVGVVFDLETSTLADIAFDNLMIGYGGTLNITEFGPVATAIITAIQTAVEAIQVAVEIMDDWDEANRAAVNTIAGQVGIAGGAGAQSAFTTRTVAATDSPEVASLEIMDDWDNGSDQCDIDIAAFSLTALPVSKDSNINATGNRIWVTSDMDMIGGVAVNTNGGAKDAGTQTVTLATDDPAVVDLAAIETAALAIQTATEAIQVATEKLDNMMATHDSAAVNEGPQEMLTARSSRPSAVADGDAVRGIANVYGERVNAGYTWSTNSKRCQIINSDSELWTPHGTTLTNIVTNTTGYITFPMSGKTGFTAQLDLTEGSTDLLTVTLECTTEHGCAPDACTYHDWSNTICGWDSLVSSDSPADGECGVDTKVFFTFCRWKYVTGNSAGNDADLEVNTITGY